jgi:hypothetical protein
MATKTISIDLEAYEKLVQGRATPTESFSSVIKRAEIKQAVGRAGAFRLSTQNLPPCEKNQFNIWDKLKDKKPDNPWE